MFTYIGAKINRKLAFFPYKMPFFKRMCWKVTSTTVFMLIVSPMTQIFAVWYAVFSEDSELYSEGKR